MAVKVKVKKKVKKKVGRKRVVKKVKPRKKNPRRDWEWNSKNISDAFATIAMTKQTIPSYKEIADACGVSEKTVERHLETIEFDQVRKKFRACTDKVLLKLVGKALKMDNHHFARLFFEVVEDLGIRKKVEVTGKDGKPLMPITGMIIE